MNYVDFKAGQYEYRLRMTTRNVVALERQLGCNPLSIFGAGDTIPSVTVMVQILHASLQSFHHGITLDDTYDIFDKYLEDGHAMTDFIAVIVEVYKASGLIANNQKKASENEKN